jgi:hypothetical protein
VGSLMCISDRIRDGQEVARLVGAVPAPQLRDWLDGNLESTAYA